jgi:N,N'-diacetyllegionaminate synthase
MHSTFIIAEAGVNHNGDLDTARKIIDAAKAAGADAVKFQTFKAEQVVSRFAPKAEYQKKKNSRSESQLEMIKRLELDENALRELSDYCQEKNIMFLSSAFDLGSVDLLYNLGLAIFKIPSGQITDLPYLRKIGGLKKEVILSTGMSDLDEIGDALEVLTEAGTLKRNITVLHCNTEYPTPMEDVNLFAMLEIEKAFGVDVGYSDHTLGIEVGIAAAALGAKVIEKHITLDRNMRGPDHEASLEPGELKAMVEAIRNIEKALGRKAKKPSDSELKNRPIVRKSIVAAKSIKKGKVITEQDLTTKRPGIGISPMQWDEVLGIKAAKNFEPDELIEL